MPKHFTLYGGTALALRLGTGNPRTSTFFERESDHDGLASSLPFLEHAERIQVAANTLSCRIERDRLMFVPFFGALRIGCVSQPDRTADTGLNMASLLDIAGTKAPVVQKRAEPTAKTVALSRAVKRQWHASMKPIPKTPELLRVAERVVWFKPPEVTLDDPLHFLAHVMTHGTREDIAAASCVVGRHEFGEALDHASARDSCSEPNRRRAQWPSAFSAC